MCSRQIDSSSFLGIEGNKFTMSKEISLALGGSFIFFIFSTSCSEFFIAYVGLKLISDGIIELSFLQTLYAGAVRYETMAYGTHGETNSHYIRS